ncbi:hypothetical protein [Flavobacterium sp.]|uniref:hypothetical protein n=1 Tax=Flavobacterium sp. TaxID=239 RepID=UPI003752EF89
MDNQSYADKYYEKFSKAEGNQHIASLFALKKIIDLVKFNNPKKILEVGLGIGSISYSVVEYLNDNKLKFLYDGTEKNEFCLQQLPLNLGNVYNQINVFPDLEYINKQNVKYDFVIIDGSDDSIDMIKDIISDHGVIFIEGDRAVQLEKIISLFPNFKYVHVISKYKDPNYGPFDSDSWSGGGKLIYINPTLKQKINYYYEKIRTYYIYKFIR